MCLTPLDNFEAIEVETEETSIFLRRFGSGPGVLLLHGFPQTHLMWREVAPLLAHRFTVICADLRGYGRSGCPASRPDHGPYSKRVMAQFVALRGSAMERGQIANAMEVGLQGKRGTCPRHPCRAGGEVIPLTQ